MLLFSKLNKMFFGYFDPVNIFLDNENNYFFGVTQPIFRLRRSTDAEAGEASTLE